MQDTASEADTPAFVDGRSMLPILDGTGPWREVALIEGSESLSKTRPELRVPSYRGIRDENYTYVEYATGEREYYDLRADPYQLTNAYASLAETRKAALHKRTRSRSVQAQPADLSRNSPYDFTPEAPRSSRATPENFYRMRMS
jgi:arylsulfatase A-like enzyme